MKKLSVTIFGILIMLALSACGTRTAEPVNTDAPAELTEEQAEEQANDTNDDKVSAIIAGMTTEEKVWQMFMVAPEDIIDIGAAIAAGEMTKNALEAYPVGGIIYFSKNIETREQVIEMISNTQSYSKIPLFIAVDEEGGRVARLGNADVGVTKFPPMAEIGASGDTDKAYEIGTTLGEELTQMGFNVDFAPVADTLTVSDNEDIGDRSFGSDANTVAQMVSAEVSGMESKNLCAVLKHFPGNGSTEANTHQEEGVCLRTLDEMRNTEFIPFKAGIDAGADMVMVAHLSVPNITGDTTPSTLSSMIINDILRNELGFENVVVSDALNMGAITSKYTPEETAVAAVKAGVDILLMPPDAPSAAAAVTEAVKNGEITEERINESVERILNLKLKRGIIHS